MTPKKAALYGLLAVIMLYMAGGEVLVTTVLQYLLNSVMSVVELIINLFVGLFHVLHLT